LVLIVNQMSDFEAERQAVFNLIAQHEDIDVLLQEVSIHYHCTTNQIVYCNITTSYIFLL